MKTLRTFPITVLLCAAFASCGRLPTDSAAAAPAAASYDSGHDAGATQEPGGLGSGTGGVIGEVGTMDGGTVQSDSTGRGGFVIGSGS